MTYFSNKTKDVTVTLRTCSRFNFTELFGRDAPHPDCGVGEATSNQAGIVCEVHCSQTLQRFNIHYSCVLSPATSRQVMWSLTWYALRKV